MRSLSMIKIALFLVCFLAAVSSAHGSELQRTTFKVANLSCQSCAVRIESELRKVPGMVGSSVDLQGGIVAADHEISLVSEDISAALNGIGYPAEKIATQGISKKEAVVYGIGTGASGASCGMGGGCGGPSNCGAAGAAWKELYRRFIKKTAK